MAQELPSFGLRVPVTRRGGGESTEVKTRQKGDGWRKAKEFSARNEGGEGTNGWRAPAYECKRGDDVLVMKMYVHEEQTDLVGSWMFCDLSTAARRKRAQLALATLLSC